MGELIEIGLVSGVAGSNEPAELRGSNLNSAMRLAVDRCGATVGIDYDTCHEVR